jgi:hypothetical protein
LFALRRLVGVFLEPVHAVIHLLGLDRARFLAQMLRELGRDRRESDDQCDRDALQDHELEHALVDGPERPILHDLPQVVGRHRHRRRQERGLQRHRHQRAEPDHHEIARDPE